MQSLSIVNYLTRNQRKIDEIVDETFFRLLQGTSSLDEIMPIENYDSRQLLMVNFDSYRPTIANIIAEEQNVPISKPRATLDETLLNDLKVGKQFFYTAKHFELMHDLQRYIRESGPRAKQSAKKIEQYFFGLTSDLVAPIIDRLTMIAIQVATTGQCIFTDPITGGRVEVVYPGILPALFPAALTGGARWNQPLTCTPLANLESHARIWFDAFGEWPEVLTMRLMNFRNIADSNEAKTARRMAMGADTAAASTEFFLEDPVVIDMIKQRTRVSEVKLFDSMYSEDLESGAEPVNRNFLADNTYFFSKKRNVIRGFVPCIEKDLMPGIYTLHEVVEKVPRQERSVAVANGLAVVKDQRYMGARVVA